MSLLEFGAVCAAAAIFAGVYIFWRHTEPPQEFRDTLSGWVWPDEHKGVPRKLSSKIRRYFKFQGYVIVAARFSVIDILKNLVFALGLAVLIYAVAGIALQPFMDAAPSDIAERVGYTSRLLLLSLANALSFDLLGVLGMEDARAHVPSVPGRAIMWAFCGLEVFVVLGASLMAITNVWTALVAIALPEPALRLSNELEKGRRPKTLLRRTIRRITTL